MNSQISAELAHQTVYLMAVSFLIGSLFTIFILIILDMLRGARESRDALNDDMLEDEYSESSDA